MWLFRKNWAELFYFKEKGQLKFSSNLSFLALEATEVFWKDAETNFVNDNFIERLSIEQVVAFMPPQFRNGNVL